MALERNVAAFGRASSFCPLMGSHAVPAASRSLKSFAKRAGSRAK